MTDSFDLLLSGGTVIDPASGTEQKLNVAITGHRIAAIGSKHPSCECQESAER
jgi:dihydroorotase